MLNFALRKSLVAMNITNQDYEGAIENAGDTVHITRPSAVTVNSYSLRTNITVQEPTETQLSLVIDQQDYFSFDVEDIEQVQANVALIPAYLEEANYGLADAADQYVFGLYTESDASNVIVKAALTASTVWAALTAAKKNLSLNNVPKSGRFVVLSPHEIELLEQSDEFQRASDLGDSVSRNGFMGRAAGFDVFESNNLTEANDGTDDVRHCVYGHRIATTFANQVAKMESQRRELRFSDLVKGLHVYGAKVIKPKALGDLRVIVA